MFKLWHTIKNSKFVNMIRYQFNHSATSHKNSKIRDSIASVSDRIETETNTINTTPTMDCRPNEK